MFESCFQKCMTRFDLTYLLNQKCYRVLLAPKLTLFDYLGTGFNDKFHPSTKNNVYETDIVTNKNS